MINHQHSDLKFYCKISVVSIFIFKNKSKKKREKFSIPNDYLLKEYKKRKLSD